MDQQTYKLGDFMGNMTFPAMRNGLAAISRHADLSRLDRCALIKEFLAYPELPKRIEEEPRKYTDLVCQAVLGLIHGDRFDAVQDVIAGPLIAYASVHAKDIAADFVSRLGSSLAPEQRPAFARSLFTLSWFEALTEKYPFHALALARAAIRACEEPARAELVQEVLDSDILPIIAGFNHRDAIRCGGRLIEILKKDKRQSLARQFMSGAVVGDFASRNPYNAMEAAIVTLAAIQPDDSAWLMEMPWLQAINKARPVIALQTAFAILKYLPPATQEALMQQSTLTTVGGSDVVVTQLIPGGILSVHTPQYKLGVAEVSERLVNSLHEKEIRQTLCQAFERIAQDAKQLADHAQSNDEYEWAVHLQSEATMSMRRINRPHSAGRAPDVAM